MAGCQQAELQGCAVQIEAAGVRGVKERCGLSVSGRPAEGENVPEAVGAEAGRDGAGRRRNAAVTYGIVAVSIGVLSVCLHLPGLAYDTVNAALLFLFPVLFAAAYGGRGPAVFAAVAGILAFDFFFIPPVWSFTVADLRYLISFAVYLAVALMTAGLAARLKRQVEAARRQERSTAALYVMSRLMSDVSDVPAVLNAFSGHIRDACGLAADFYVPDKEGELRPFGLNPPLGSMKGTERGQETLGQNPELIARWVYRHGEPAGQGTGKLGGSSGWFMPLKAEDQTYGVAEIHALGQDLSPAVVLQVEALSGLAGSALARIKRGEDAKLAQLTAESERMRTALLDSVSHELRTPLAAIIGSSTGLLESGELFSEEDRAELLGTIRDGALRMNRLVTNLLGMVQLESGMIKMRREWLDVGELAGIVIRQLKEALGQRKVRLRISEDLPPLPGDIVLLEQMLANIVSNAIKYSPDGSDIRLEAFVRDRSLALRIEDEGAGLSEEEGRRIFDKFYRSEATRHIPGTGLGLSIAKGIAEMHGGSISAGPGSVKGAAVTVLLPLSMPSGGPPSESSDPATESRD